jgi:hypothetical protein
LDRQEVDAPILKAFKELNDLFTDLHNKSKLEEITNIEELVEKDEHKQWIKNILDEIPTDDQIKLLKVKCQANANNIPDLIGKDTKDDIEEFLADEYKKLVAKRKTELTPAAGGPVGAVGGAVDPASSASSAAASPAKAASSYAFFCPHKDNLFQATPGSAAKWVDPNYAKQDALFAITFAAENVLTNDEVTALKSAGLKQTSGSGLTFHLKENADKSFTAELRKDDALTFDGETPELQQQRLMRTMLDMTLEIVAYSKVLTFSGTNKHMVTAGVLFAQNLQQKAGLGNLDIKFNPTDMFKPADQEYKDIVKFLAEMGNKWMTAKTVKFTDTAPYKKAKAVNDIPEPVHVSLAPSA